MAISVAAVTTKPCGGATQAPEFIVVRRWAGIIGRNNPHSWYRRRYINYKTMFILNVLPIFIILNHIYAY
jgi:hypothetical protein